MPTALEEVAGSGLASAIAAVEDVLRESHLNAEFLPIQYLRKLVVGPDPELAQFIETVAKPSRELRLFGRALRIRCLESKDQTLMDTASSPERISTSRQRSLPL